MDSAHFATSSAPFVRRLTGVMRRERYLTSEGLLAVRTFPICPHEDMWPPQAHHVGNVPSASLGGRLACAGMGAAVVAPLASIADSASGRRASPVFIHVGMVIAAIRRGRRQQSEVCRASLVWPPNRVRLMQGCWSKCAVFVSRRFQLWLPLLP